MNNKVTLNIDSASDKNLSISTRPSLEITEGHGASKQISEMTIIQTSDISIVQREIQTEDCKKFELFYNLFTRKLVPHETCQTVAKLQDEAFKKYFGISVDDFKSLKAEGWNSINQTNNIHLFVSNIKNLSQLITLLIRNNKSCNEVKFLLEFFDEIKSFLELGKNCIEKEILKSFKDTLALEKQLYQLAEKQLDLYLNHSKVFPDTTIIFLPKPRPLFYKKLKGTVNAILQQEYQNKMLVMKENPTVIVRDRDILVFLEPKSPRSLNPDQAKLKEISKIICFAPKMPDQKDHLKIVSAVEEMLSLNDAELNEKDKTHLNSLNDHLSAVINLYTASYTKTQDVYAFLFGLKLQKILFPEAYKNTLKTINGPSGNVTPNICDKYDILILRDFIESDIFTFSQIKKITIEHGGYDLQYQDERAITDAFTTNLLFNFLSINKDNFKDLKCLQFVDTHFGDVKIPFIPSLQEIRVQLIIGNLIIPTLPNLTTLSICQVSHDLLVDQQPCLSFVDIWGFGGRGATFILPENGYKIKFYGSATRGMTKNEFEYNGKFLAFSSYNLETINNLLQIDLFPKLAEIDFIDSSLAIDILSNSEKFHNEIVLKSTSLKQVEANKELAQNQSIKTEIHSVSISLFNPRNVITVGALAILMIYLISLMQSKDLK